ncbi:MAG: isoprenylcysteine carboxylmethyltransferase family protein [Steroidobacter sp.]
MSYLHQYLFPSLWVTWLLLWLILGRNVKPAARRESQRSRLSYTTLILFAAILLWPDHFPLDILNRRFLPPSQNEFWVGILFTLAGLGFSVWARLELGRNWSGTVTVKHDHELVTTGPYRVVRHPIYTGMLLAFIGVAIANAEWRGIVALVLAFIALLKKFKTEERFMREQFGDVYVDYSRRVSAIIPFVF